MSSERWQQIESVLQQALDLPPTARDSFLDTMCAGDDDLRQEANSLIDAHDRAGDFIEKPALASDAEVLFNMLPDPNIGRLVGAYKVVKRLGAGGMGEVYLAEDARLGRCVALKVLPPTLVTDPEQLRRFHVEAKAISTLNHPNVLTIHEIGQDADTHFIATEFVDGRTVRELINGDSLNLMQVVEICIQVGSALGAAHDAGIVHRDIKPENIMRRPDGLVKVLDFGIAKSTVEAKSFLNGQEEDAQRTEVGIILGTVGYMSPEQARGLAVDERTDVWSLGVVLYEMMAKRPPFAGPTRMDTLAGILERQPPALLAAQHSQAGKRLQQIIDKCLRKDCADRYQTMSELLEDLRRAQEDLKNAGSLKSVILNGPTTRLSRRNSITAVAVAIVLGLIALTWLWERPKTDSTAILLTTKLYQNMTSDERQAFIAQQEQRISAMMGDRPVKLNQDALEAIENELVLYVSRTNSNSLESGTESLSEIYHRAIPYVPLITKEFAARKVPIAIGIYLPMIEAEYRPCDENEIGAKGIFQFLPATARQYGVAPEEMCDVNKMAPAAAQYIADRMAELGEDSQSITLVLLSYNRGPEWVRDTLRDLRGTENYQRNFWTLYANRELLDNTFRNENAGYVPKFFAAAIVGENPTVFGINIQPLSTLATR